MTIASLQNRRDQDRGKATKKRVLSAAEHLLTREGLGATNLARICEISGVSVGSVYHHFGSKEGILVKLIAEFCERAREDVNQANLDRLPPDQALRTIVLTTVKQFRENPGIFRATAEQISDHPEVWQPMRDLRKHYEAKLLPVMRRELEQQGISDPKEGIAKMMQVILALLTHVVIFDSNPISFSEQDAETHILSVAKAVLYAQPTATVNSR